MSEFFTALLTFIATITVYGGTKLGLATKVEVEDLRKDVAELKTFVHALELKVAEMDGGLNGKLDTLIRLMERKL